MNKLDTNAERNAVQSGIVRELVELRGMVG